MGNCEQITIISFSIRCGWVTRKNGGGGGINGMLVLCRHVVLSENDSDTPDGMKGTKCTVFR